MRRVVLVTVILIAVLGTLLYGEDFVFVDGGGMTYTMDSRGSEVVHDIYVDDFQMGATEVTVAQWREFIDDIDYDFPWTGHFIGDIAELSPEDDCPIQLVRINEAIAYCNWRSIRDGLEIVYLVRSERIVRDITANGYRLPTVAEWDYAARGGKFSHGYIYSGSDNPDEIAWFGRPFEEGTHPVATKAPNELGLYDMTGNIREWCWPRIGIPCVTLGSDEKLRLRGGTWMSTLEQIRLDFDRVVQVYLWSSAGFRLTRNAD